MKRFMLLALFALALIAGSLPGAAVASTRASSGAHVIDFAFDHEEPEDGSIWYFTLKGVATGTLTPEGNKIYTGNMRGTSTLYDADGTFVMRGEGTSHQLRLIQEPTGGDNENFHVWSDRFAMTMTYADGSVCTFTFTLQYVNEQFRILKDTVVCK